METERGASAIAEGDGQTEPVLDIAEEARVLWASPADVVLCVDDPWLHCPGPGASCRS